MTLPRRLRRTGFAVSPQLAILATLTTVKTAVRMSAKREFLLCWWVWRNLASRRGAVGWPLPFGFLIA